MNLKHNNENKNLRLGTAENKHEEDNANLDDSFESKNIWMLACLLLHLERGGKVGFYSYLYIGTRVRIIVRIDQKYHNAVLYLKGRLWKHFLESDFN